jgi:hypothetical protein
LGVKAADPTYLWFSNEAKVAKHVSPSAVARKTFERKVKVREKLTPLEKAREKNPPSQARRPKQKIKENQKAAGRGGSRAEMLPNKSFP